MSVENNFGKLVVICGPSCSGKTSIIDKFLDSNPNFSRMVSDTTRPPRLGEKDGVDYYFLAEKDFKERKNSGYYIEIDEYRSGDFKALPRSYFDNLLDGKSYISPITVKIGHDFCSHLNLDDSMLAKIKPRIIPVYIGVSNLITLWHRFKKRNDGTGVNIFKSTFKKDYQDYLKYQDFFPDVIKNDNSIEESVAELSEIIARK